MEHDFMNETISSTKEAQKLSRIRNKLTVAVVSGAMAVGAIWASQEMSDQFQNDVRDCVERADAGVEECTYPDAGMGVGDDNSGFVEILGYGLAALSAVSLVGAKREAE